MAEKDSLFVTPTGKALLPASDSVPVHTFPRKDFERNVPTADLYSRSARVLITVSVSTPGGEDYITLLITKGVLLMGLSEVV